MPNRESVPPNNIIMRMQTSAASKLTESELLGHGTPSDPNDTCSYETTRNALLEH